MSDRASLASLALAFLRLGTIAFGGPAAHLAMMQKEFVERRGWLTREELVDLIGAASLIPGPSSTEVAIYVGQRRAGWRGLLLAGLGFILPAAAIVTAIAWAYVRFGTRPAAGAVLHGVKAAVVPIVAQAVVALGRTAMKNARLVALGVGAAAANALGVHPLVALLGAGLVNVLLVLPGARRGASAALAVAVSAAANGAASARALGKVWVDFS
jgi:chromate transporter